jgi:GAF domain-containing protein
VPETKPPEFVSAVADLHALMVTSPQVGHFLQHATQLAGRLTGGMSCSITVGSEHPFTVTPTDELAQRVDEVQYGEGAGPCLDAIRTESATVVEDVDADGPWPDYRRRAREAGVRSSLSLPLTVAGSTIGGLNLYSRAPNGFQAPLRETLGAFAAQAAAALEMVQRSERSAQTRAQLEEALTSRSVIDQALGIVMAQQRCTAEQALTLLRSQSQHSNRKLRDVAADLIERVTGAPPVPGTPFRGDEQG